VKDFVAPVVIMLLGLGGQKILKMMGKQRCSKCNQRKSNCHDFIKCDCCLRSFNIVCTECANTLFMPREKGKNFDICQECDSKYREQIIGIIVTETDEVEGCTIKTTFEEMSSYRFSNYADHESAKNLLKYRALHCGANAIMCFRTESKGGTSAYYEPGTITIENDTVSYVKGTPVIIEKKMKQKAIDKIKSFFER